MANICSNWLTILSEDKKELVHRLFKELVVRQHKTNERQCFDVADEKYMDNFSFDDNEIGSLSYETDWATNDNDVIKLAKKHKFNFRLDYEELGSDYVGFVVYDYEKDELTEYHLDENLMNLVKENEHGEYYLVDKDGIIREDHDCETRDEFYAFLLEEQYNLTK